LKTRKKSTKNNYLLIDLSEKPSVQKRRSLNSNEKIDNKYYFHKKDIQKLYDINYHSRQY